MEKFYEENCLYEQHFIKDESVTIGEMIDQAIAKLGENISIRRFVRFKVGEIAGARAAAPAAPAPCAQHELTGNRLSALIFGARARFEVPLCFCGESSQEMQRAAVPLPGGSKVCYNAADSATTDDHCGRYHQTASERARSLAAATGESC